MKKILIIEDDNFKSDSICNFLNNYFNKPLIKIITSQNEAILDIGNNHYDLIIIDMAIPSHPIEKGEGTPISVLDGGINIILELQELQHFDKCIVLTQYPHIEIDDKYYPVSEGKDYIKQILDFDVLECIEYIEADPRWENSFKQILGKYESFNSRR